MKAAHVVAKAITAVAVAMANKAHGSASAWGTYQPKEPVKTAKK